VCELFSTSPTGYHNQIDSKSVSTQNWQAPNCINPCTIEAAAKDQEGCAKKRGGGTHKPPNNIVMFSAIRKIQFFHRHQKERNLLSYEFLG